MRAQALLRGTPATWLANALLWLGMAALPAATTAAEPPKTYTLAVVPYQLSLTVYKDWLPLTEQLSEKLKVTVELRVYQSFPQFEAELLQGVPDLVFMNPYHQVLAKKHQGYLPIVRSSRELSGVLVVRGDSPIKTVRDLDGKAIGFPSPNAFGASLYIRALLTEREKIRFTPRYLESHNEVYRHVVLGEVDAGGGIRYTLQREPTELRSHVRVVYETPKTSPHAFAAHPRVPAAARQIVLQTVLGMNESELGRSLLASLQLAAPVPADYARDYQPLERLGLDKYVVMSR